MKKLALTSLVAVFAVSGANAANIINNNNPLYRPNAGHFYSITSLDSSTQSTNVLGLSEEFAYGITDRLAIGIQTSVAEKDWFDASEWSDFNIGLNFRALDMGNWNGDVYAYYGVLPVWGDHQSFLDEDKTFYNWNVGVRAGYVTAGWTLAGHVEFGYLNSESFNWGDEGVHAIAAGVDGQLVLNPNWNLTAGAEYTTIVDDEIAGVKLEHTGSWDVKLGANYNIDESKFIGAYMTKTIAHTDAGVWDVMDGFGYGVKFGIDF